MQRIGKIRIAGDMLVDLLDYEHGEITGATFDLKQGRPVVVLTVMHQDMPQVSDDDEIPTVTPWYKTNERRYERVKNSKGEGASDRCASPI